MKRTFAVITLVLAVFISAGYLNRAQAQQATVDIGVFYDSLAPHGPWIELGENGYAWQPAEVGPEWRPYRDGEWAWSEAGWTWVSSEPWGWATYHYGRWINDDYYGWLWIPGPTWAPAYVSWYQSPGYIGWAPLPPDNYFSVEIGYYFGNWGLGFSYGTGGYGYGGYGIGFNYAYYGGGYKKHHNHHHKRHHKRHYVNHHDYRAPSHHSTFVNTEHFGHKNSKLVAIPDSHNYTVVNKSRNITNIKVQNNNYLNYGPDWDYVNQKTRGKLKRVELVDRDITLSRGSRQVNRIQGDNYNVYRPNVTNSGRKPSHFKAIQDLNKDHTRRNYSKSASANPKNINKYARKNFDGSESPEYPEYNNNRHGRANYSSKQQSSKLKGDGKVRGHSNPTNSGRRNINFNNNKTQVTNPANLTARLLVVSNRADQLQVGPNLYTNKKQEVLNKQAVYIQVKQHATLGTKELIKVINQRIAFQKPSRSNTRLYNQVVKDLHMLSLYNQAPTDPPAPSTVSPVMVTTPINEGKISRPGTNVHTRAAVNTNPQAQLRVPTARPPIRAIALTAVMSPIIPVVIRAVCKVVAVGANP